MSFSYTYPTTPKIYTLSLHDALPISREVREKQLLVRGAAAQTGTLGGSARSEEHTSELQSLRHLVCRLLLEKKKWRLTGIPTAYPPHPTTPVSTTWAQRPLSSATSAR